MRVNDELIEKLSKLAKLEFSGEERAEIKKDLTRMLEFVEKLNEIDTENVEPLIHMTTESNHFREDVAEYLPIKSKALANAPSHDSDYFRVPKVRDNK